MPLGSHSPFKRIQSLKKTYKIILRVAYLIFDKEFIEIKKYFKDIHVVPIPEVIIEIA